MLKFPIPRSMQKDASQMIVNDFNITRVNSPPPPNKEGGIHTFKVSATRLVEKIEKYKQSKDRLKK